MSNINNKTENVSARDMKRRQLVELSQLARKVREAEGLTCSLNQIIIERFYKSGEHQEFALLRAWNERGYKVKKGSQAFVIWGKKRKATRKEQENEEESNYKFYPLAYLFSNAQVIEQ